MKDLMTWTRAQAGALRRAACGADTSGLDWEGVAEEIESIGRIERPRHRRQLTAIIESHLMFQHTPLAVAAELHVEWVVLAAAMRKTVAGYTPERVLDPECRPGLLAWIDALPSGRAAGLLPPPP
jgi:hypothetical protein